MNPAITVLVDSREQRTMHIAQRFSELGIPFKIKKLSFGDYSFEYQGKSFETICCVERKNAILELLQSLFQGRKRFEDEFNRAMAAGAKMDLIIEDEDGRKKMPLRKLYDPYIKKINNEWVWIENEQFPKMTLKKALNQTWKSYGRAVSAINSLGSWKLKYNIDVIFCHKDRIADEMLKVFYKAIKEYEVEAKPDESQIQRTNSQVEET